jgi:hypothetical protein
MRYRIVDFLPLLLALGLIGVWLAFQQPLPWLPQLPRTAAAPTSQPVAVAKAAATPTLQSRAIALQSLCDATRPRFLGSLASLKERLGARMGEARDCEQPVDDAGNTEQLTTTGLAYYRRDLNLAAFTNGYDHWALDDERMVHWTGSAVEPPSDAASEP